MPRSPRIETIRRATAGVFTLAWLAAWAPPALDAQALGEEINRIVLRVNEEVLTLHDYEQRKAERINRILADTSLDNNVRQELLSVAGRQLLKAAFDEMLIVSRARQLSVVVEDHQVDAAIQELRETQGIRSEEEMNQALTAAGLTLDTVRTNIRRELQMQQVMGREVHTRIDVSDEALRLYYRANDDQFRIPEERRLEEVIVLSSSGLDDTQLRGIADEISRAVGAGASLEEAAQPYSDQELVTGVIDLGWLEAGDLSGDLQSVAWALEPGDYSAPTAGRGGLHILHLLELKEGRLRPFSEVEEEIRNRERARLFRKELIAYMGELADRAFIHENLPPDAVGYRNIAGEPERDPDELELFRAPTLAPEPGEAADGR